MRKFQFSLVQLFGLLLPVALFCLAIRHPTPLSCGLVVLVTTTLQLSSVVFAIYRMGGVRAFAIGFAVFLGALIYLQRFDYQDDLKTMEVTNPLFKVIHPTSVDPNLMNDDFMASYDERDFATICRNGFYVTFGIAGGMLAVGLYFSRAPSRQPI